MTVRNTSLAPFSSLATAVLLLGLLLSMSTQSYADDGFVDLFNGKDFSGWEFVVGDAPSSNGEEFFAVEKGMIHVYPNSDNGTKQPFAGIYTKDTYENYHLSLEYKWGESKFAPRENAVRDAGVIFHVVGTPVIWPTGIECQIQEGDTGDMWIIGQTRASSYVQPIAYNYDARGDLLTRGAGRNPQRFPRSNSWEIEGWNLVEVLVEGSHAVFKVNGHVVNEAVHMRYREDENDEWEWKALTSGRIFLQAEGAELYYRNIKLKSL